MVLVASLLATDIPLLSFFASADASWRHRSLTCQGKQPA